MIDAPSFRFIGWGAAGWYISAGVLVFFGTVGLAEEGVPRSPVFFGTVLVVGLVLGVSTTRVRLSLSEESVLIRNHWRRYRVPVQEIATVRSVTTTVPLMAWPPYGQLHVLLRSPQRAIALAVSTGVSEKRARDIVAGLEAAAQGSIQVEVDYRCFPTQRVGRDDER